jgi:fosfomycin resistance protein FosX
VGLGHLTFIVSNLDRMEALLTTVLNARKVFDRGSQTFSLARERFFLVGRLWIATIEAQSLPARSYNYIAFKIDDADEDACLARVTSLGLDLREGRPRLAAGLDVANQQLRLLPGHHPVKVLGVLVEILRFDRITTQECGLCECQIALVLSFGAGHTVVAVSASLTGRSGRTETRPRTVG